jgi:hypothetical protein
MTRIVDDTVSSRAQPQVLDDPPVAHLALNTRLPIDGSMLLPSAKIAVKSV